MNSPVPRPRLNITENMDPFALFADWYQEAATHEPNDPDAAALGTVAANGMPNVRMVLVKRVTEAGFVFFTNTLSQKGQELAVNPHAALCFHWKTLGRQVRVQGRTVHVDNAEADAYFASRHPRSRLGAIASRQSQPLDDIADLEAQVAELQNIHPNPDSIARPDHWSGYRIVPVRIEFWQQGDNRLHDRFVFTRPDDSTPWACRRLYP